jgi:hypothetical protein
MNEENQTNTTVNDNPKKKGGKTKIIIIAVLAVILVAAIVIGILLATGVLDFNVSKKSKMVAGVEKLGESIVKPLEDMSEDEENSIKILNNVSKESGLGVSEEITVNVDNLDIKTLSSENKKNLKSIVDLLNNAKMGIDARYDGNEKAYAKLNLNLDDISLSGEAIYDGDQGAMRSEEINSKWLTIGKHDIEVMLREQNLDIDDIKEYISNAMDQVTELVKSVDVDEKAQKEIKERYEKVLKDFINEKSKSIESEKDKVKVNGKNKNCEKLTLTLKESDVKELLKEYVKTFKNDKQMQDILKNSLNTYSKMLENNELNLNNDIEDIVDEMISELDNLEEEIDELEFEGTITLTVYATNTEVYRTDISIEIEEIEVVLETTFNDGETVTQISAKSAGRTLEVATVTIKSDSNSYNVKIETASGLEQYIEQKMSMEINYKNEKNRDEVSINIDAGTYGKGTIVISSDMNKNEENEYESNMKIDIDIDIPQVIELKGDLGLKINMKTRNIEIPSIPSSNSINIADKTDLEEYLAEAQENITKLMEKVSNNEALRSLVEGFSNGFNSTITPEIDYNTIPELDF